MLGKTIVRWMVVCVVLMMSASSAMAAFEWEQVLTLDSARDRNASTTFGGFAVDGSTIYVQLYGNRAPAIVKITGVGTPLQSPMTLVSPQQWTSAYVSQALSAGYGFGLSSCGMLQFADQASDAVYRIGTSGGSLQYVSKSTILYETGLTTESLSASSTIAPNGEMVIYEASSKSLLITTNPGSLPTSVGAVQTYLTQAEIAAAEGVAEGLGSISGGLAFDASGGLYFADDATGLYRQDATSGAICRVSTIEAMTGVTGKSSFGFGDVYVGPDGLVYIYDSVGHGLVTFDPTTGASGLLAGSSELHNGGNDIVQLDWYNGHLAWVTKYDGVYAMVPEPMTVVLLAAGGVAMLRRRAA